MTNAPSQAPSPYFQEIIDQVEKALAEAAIVARKKAQETGTPLVIREGTTTRQENAPS